MSQKGLILFILKWNPMSVPVKSLLPIVNILIQLFLPEIIFRPV
jgi:hypothetical protein